MEKGVGSSGKPLHCKGSTFHKVIPQFMCQGGEFTTRNGTGSESTYGTKFEDDNFVKKHIGPGVLPMANTSHGNHLVFGPTVDGVDVVCTIEKIGSYIGRTLKLVVIPDCIEDAVGERS
ncbi:hypothetical protein Taro_036398 [Colocasia esculenta]|uniref:Peptidyl-prolyl cis-trans isomerase n=1 Tax=Colocasia esculenta TaxID=4460 RepID=A0A843W9M5_COLES|nr:hypothetical protein [Colocasia esculenta]